MRDVSRTILDAMAGAGFLQLPSRSAPPRSTGITSVLDTGLSLERLSALPPSITRLVDVWKFGWGTAYLDPDVAAKVAVLRELGIKACAGGTLLEVAWQQGRAGQCLSWAEEIGLTCLEVSNGVVSMPAAEKHRLIAVAAERFEVLAEIGSKDPAVPVSAESWVDEAVGDLAAGARWIVTEGRESGTVGLFAPDGHVRTDVVEALVAAVDLHTLFFEAPIKSQQAWFIRRYGANVNLGNVPVDSLLGLEALRCGLRADTVDVMHSNRVADAWSAHA